MLSFVADEDFTRAIVRGVLRARPDIDLVRVQDVGLRTQEDTVSFYWRNAVERVNGKGKYITSRCGDSLARVASEEDPRRNTGAQAHPTNCLS